MGCEVQVTQSLMVAALKVVVVHSLFRILKDSIFTRDNAKAEIVGKGRVEEWPATIHLCMQKPVEITEEALVDGLEIRKTRYKIKGIIHCRVQGEWSVSVQRAGDWHCLGKDSTPEEQTDREALLCGVVLIQLIREDTEGLATAEGLLFSIIFEECCSF